MFEESSKKCWLVCYHFLEEAILHCSKKDKNTIFLSLFEVNRHLLKDTLYPSFSMWKSLLILLIFIWAAWHIRWRRITRDIETPNAKSSMNGDIEIREVPSLLVASVIVPWDEYTSGNQAFRQLAGFIFGDNQSRSSIEMTAPVTSKPITTSEKIAMTAPVTSTPKGQMTEVSFIMPSKRTKDTLPIPNNSNITITETLPVKRAVWGFSGYATSLNAWRNKGDFLTALAQANIQRTGDMTLAQYNDPMTPPWMRTNEWWVEIVDDWELKIED